MLFQQGCQRGHLLIAYFTSNKFLKYHLPAYLWAVVIFIGSSFSLKAPRIIGDLSDKLFHFGEFAIFGFLVARSLKNVGIVFLKKHFFLSAFLIGSLYGLSDECHQLFVFSRGFELSDFLADSLGNLAGAIIYTARAAAKLRYRNGKRDG